MDFIICQIQKLGTCLTLEASLTNARPYQTIPSRFFLENLNIEETNHLNDDVYSLETWSFTMSTPLLGIYWINCQTRDKTSRRHGEYHVAILIFLDF